MVKAEIIRPVSTPTSWISSLVIVAKANGKLRLCIDPKDLNTAIRREIYHLPTIEEIATRLKGAKYFTVLDVRSGFWHVKLSESSSQLTTFNTPKGRYQWLRMPFGISSAPEVFQRRMHEIIEGLVGVEVVADDFCVVGFGDTLREAAANHDRNLLDFLERCKEKGLRLSADKFQLRQQEVRFIGHVASGEGLKIDPLKVQAVSEMPAPTDGAAVLRCLGMVQYLAKFMPHLSDLVLPIRNLARRNAEWVWGSDQAAAWAAIKAAVQSAPVLRYYSLSEEVTLQADASQSGLGAALMQNGQPVAYASRALSPTECRYAQIEKEMLAIVFACERFNDYIYRRNGVNVETDHKPLEVIKTKPLNNASARLQRMMLRLQRYDLRVRYKQGKFMYLADTLSRAFAPWVGDATRSCNGKGAVAGETDLPIVIQVSESSGTKRSPDTPPDRMCQEIDTMADKDEQFMELQLPISVPRLERLRASSRADVNFKILKRAIREGWPDHRSQVDSRIRSYFEIRAALSISGCLIYKGLQLVVPTDMRREMIDSAHAAHQGENATVARMRECLYWPRMTADTRAVLGTCDICLAHRPLQRKETLMDHDIPNRPWAKVAADLCEIHGRTLLVVVDFFSDYIEVAKLTGLNTPAVTRALGEMFAHHGIPDTIVSDNGPQFASAAFAAFCETWDVAQVTSSPRYAQSNGKAESAVKVMKTLFAKCKESGRDEFLALLEQRNTPTPGLTTSPAQRLMGRRCRTLLPMAQELLQPAGDIDEVLVQKAARRAASRLIYNKTARPLREISSGDAIRMRLPGEVTWTAGVCVGRVGPRSYDVRVGGSIYRRNRKHIMLTHEIPELTPENEWFQEVRDGKHTQGGPNGPGPNQWGAAADNDITEAVMTPRPPGPNKGPTECKTAARPEAAATETFTAVQQPELRRSARVRHAPAKLNDYQT